MRHRDTFDLPRHSADRDGSDPAPPPEHVPTTDLRPLPTTGVSVEQRLADLTSAQRARVRAVLPDADIDALDPVEVIDLCDRISGQITFAEYQARGRAQRSATKGR